MLGLNTPNTSVPLPQPFSWHGYQKKKVALPQVSITRQFQGFESHSTFSSSSGNINIVDIDSDGKFIKLHNESDEVYVNFV